MTLSNKAMCVYHKLPMIDSLENGGVKKVKSSLSGNFKRILEIIAV